MAMPLQSVRLLERISSHQEKRYLPSFLFRQALPSYVLQHYCAAGVLLYAKTNRKPKEANYVSGKINQIESENVVFLLGHEARKSRDNYWLHFGGKKEIKTDTDPASTAMRELDEETACLFHENLYHWKDRLQEPSMVKLWWKPGKYVLFFLEIEYDEKLPSKFAEIDKTNDYTRLHLCKYKELRWICGSDLLVSAQTHGSIIVDEKETSLERFFYKMLRVPSVIDHLQELLIR